MTFVYPTFLWALSAIAVPIIIHLFNFRTHKTVYFSNVAFLQNIEQESKSRNRFKDLLILLCRILTVAALVIAFAKPVLFSNFSSNSDCSNQYAIYLDNSFSMSALNIDGTNIDVSKAKASEITNSFSLSSKYLYITNEISSEQQHFYTKEICQANISKTQVSPFFRKTGFVFSKFSDLFNSLSSDCSNRLFVISDFQKNTFDPENFVLDTNTRITLIPVTPTETSNLSIDSVWFDSPFHLQNATDSISVRIKNYSSNDFVNQPIRLFLNDSLKTISTFNISANTETVIKIIFSNLKTGFIQGKIEIDDYPITYDNSIFFDYYIAPKVKVLLIEGKDQSAIKQFYTDSSFFELTVSQISNIPYSDFYKYQAIIFAQLNNISSGLQTEIDGYVKNGGNLVIIPSILKDLTVINSFLSYMQMPVFGSVDTSKIFVKKINLSDKIYKNVFEQISENSEMPVVFSHLTISNPNTFGLNKLIVLQNDDVFLLSKENGLGNIYLFSTEMSKFNTDFMSSPVSVPTFYNIPVFSRNNTAIYSLIGNSENIELKNIGEFENLKLKNKKTGFEFYPQISKTSENTILINLNNLTLEAGHYILTTDEKQEGVISLNYNRKESDLNFYNVEELKELLKKYNLKNFEIISNSGTLFQKEIKNDFKGKNLWKLFIIFALFFILCEILIIRFYKNKK